MIDFEKIAHDFWSQQPHPDAPGVTIGDYPIAMRLATAAKFGGVASAKETEAFWKEYKALAAEAPELTPDRFEQVLDQLAPLSFTFHGRPPSMHEIKALSTAHPTDQRKHYTELPDKDYPSVTAGQMVSGIVSAEPHARHHVGRPPLKNEVEHLVHSKTDPAAYYSTLNGPRDNGAGHPGVTGDGPTR